MKTNEASGVPPIRIDCVKPGSLELAPHPSEPGKMVLSAKVRLEPLINFFPIVMTVLNRDAQKIVSAVQVTTID